MRRYPIGTDLELRSDGSGISIDDLVLVVELELELELEFKIESLLILPIQLGGGSVPILGS